MGVVNFLRSRSLVHSCFERRTAPVHSTIYESKDVFVCQVLGSLANQMSGRVCATKCFPLAGWLAGLLPGWQFEDQRCAGSVSTRRSDG